MWSIIKSNLRYNKLGSIVVLFFVTIAVFLMIVGTSLMVNINTVMDDKLKELGEANIEITYSTETAEQLDIVTNRLLSYDKIIQYELSERYTTPELRIFTPSYDNSENVSGSFDCAPIRKEGKFPHKIINEQLISDNGYPIYYSNYYSIKNTYKLGDKIKLSDNNGSIEFYVAGFVETINSLYNGIMYMPEDSYNAIREFGAEGTIKALMLVNVKDYNMRSVSAMFNYMGSLEENESQDSPIKCSMSMFDGSNNVSSTTSFAMLVGVIMMLFAIILSVIALIVIRFLIVSNIEDNIKNIGVIKSIGYSNKEIRLSYLLQYGIIFAIGIVIGLVLALALMNQFSAIITIITNVALTMRVNAVMAITSIIVIAAIIGLVLYLITRRINKIQPIMALRRGVTTHSFKKNHIPLDKVKCNNNVAMSLKGVANNVRQSVMMVVVILLMAFVSAFTSVLYYNTNVNTAALMPVVGMETNDITLRFNENYYDIALNNDLVEDYNTQISVASSLRLDNDLTANAIALKDYGKQQVDFMYKGRMPQNNNEIAVHQSHAKYNGYKIGDYINVKVGELEYELIVCGITQGININYAMFVTYDFANSVNDLIYANNEFYEEFLHRNLVHKLYLKEGVSFDDYMDFIKGQDVVRASINDNQAAIEDTLSSFSIGATMLMTIMIVITALVLAMLIIMIVSLKISRERISMAISKAIGYRSRDIILQITLNMVMLTTIGSIIGVLLGALLTSPLLLIALNGYGVMKVLFAVNWWYILGIFVMVPILTVLFTMLVSLGVTKISPSRLRS